VTLTFRPASFRWGSWLSLVGVGLAAGLIIWGKVGD
jgi:hypothetical protein